MAAQRKRTFRVVKEGDTPAPRRKASPKTLKAAAELSERDLLVKMRDTISDTIGAGAPPHTLAPLMRQLKEIDKEIRALDKRAEQEAEDHSGEDVDDTFDASAL